MGLSDVRTYRWTLDRYLDMAETGVLANERVELIDGEIIKMAPQKDPHSLSISNVIEELLPIFPRPRWVKSQSTFRLGERSAPEPDVMVLPERKDTGRALHDLPLLVVEVSDTTLDYDRGHKASMYAARGIKDYWVVNIPDDQVEVHRAPVKDATVAFKWRYSSITIHRRGDKLEPLKAPGQWVAADRLLP